MSFFKSLFSFFKHKKVSRASRPTLTILMAINPEFEDREKCLALLDEQAKKLSFLNPVTVLVDTVKDYQDYNRFCKQDLAAAFDTDFVLVIQRDGKVINPSAWTDDFFKYDYIGAPWRLTHTPTSDYLKSVGKDPLNRDLYVGNGGFSLRSKALCLAVAELAENTKQNEDSYICRNLRDALEARGFKFALFCCKPLLCRV